MADLALTAALAKAFGKPTDEQITTAVDAWLDDHPEATTTVEDGAITEAKLNSSLQGTLGEFENIKGVFNYPAVLVDGQVNAEIPVAAVSDRQIEITALGDVKPGEQLYWNVDTVAASSEHASDFSSMKIRCVQYNSGDSVLSRTDYPSNLNINASTVKAKFFVLYTKSATSGVSGSSFSEVFNVKFQCAYNGNFNITLNELDSVLTEQGDTWEV